ncbi:hypothetical protein [Tenacibaculum jejuense]|uniref:Lipoprotein n=1 Tax=Tenacibaculum jejuense TaxID=584609 RepID=A0A238UGK4_9FLAO|nr:hypothetical protein [Tenacibaculum jejuense]SNR17480.1 exported protein of unknown function [Tenacibaculum jejuense]
MKAIKILITVLVLSCLGDVHAQITSSVKNNIEIQDYESILIKGNKFNEVLKTNGSKEKIEDLLNEEFNVEQSSLGYGLKRFENDFYKFYFSDEDEDGEYDLESFEIKKSSIVFKSIVFNIGDSLTSSKFEGFIVTKENDGSKVIVLKDHEVGATIFVKFDALTNRIKTISYSSNN